MLSEIQWGKKIQGEVIDFTMMECGGCGIPFYVPTRWYNSKVKNHGEFHCPNGCNRIFAVKTEAEKLKEKLAEKEKREQELQDKWLDALGEKYKLEKQLKRVHKGVCPCCNRSFVNLQRHMKTKHPEVAKK